jgi:hypothetical protein
MIVLKDLLNLNFIPLSGLSEHKIDCNRADLHYIFLRISYIINTSNRNAFPGLPILADTKKYRLAMRQGGFFIKQKALLFYSICF